VGKNRSLIVLFAAFHKAFSLLKVYYKIGSRIQNAKGDGIELRHPCFIPLEFTLRPAPPAESAQKALVEAGGTAAKHFSRMGGKIHKITHSISRRPLF
jgi:hypothetical protein